jgi:hypothetical protein
MHFFLFPKGLIDMDNIGVVKVFQRKNVNLKYFEVKTVLHMIFPNSFSCIDLAIAIFAI